MQKNRLRLKTKKSKKHILIISAIFLALCITGATIVWLNSKGNGTGATASDIRPQNTVDYSPANKDDNKDIEDVKNNPPKEPTTVDNQTTNPSGTVPFSVVVTGANADNAGKVARVSTLVNGTSDGVCTVTFSQSGQSSVVATNQVELQNNNYACPNFVIPYSQFPTSGQWEVSVSVNSGGKTATGQWQGGSITINK